MSEKDQKRKVCLNVSYSPTSWGRLKPSSTANHQKKDKQTEIYKVALTSYFF